MRLVVGLDLDGVTFNFDQGWRKAYDLWFDGQFSDRTSTQWDFHDETHFGSMTEFYKWAQRANVFGSLEPIPGALGGIHTWLEASIGVLFTTSRPEWAAGATSACLARYGLVPDRLGRSGMELRFEQEKWKALAGVYVDDSPEVLKGLKAHGKTTIRYTQPWNKRVPATVAVDNWKELTNVVLEMAGVVA